MGDNAPMYVTCACPHCEGHIEFDANELSTKSATVPCPHCWLAVKLVVPASIPPPLPKEPEPTPAKPEALKPEPVRREGFFCGDSEAEQRLSQIVHKAGGKPTFAPSASGKSEMANSKRDLPLIIHPVSGKPISASQQSEPCKRDEFEMIDPIPTEKFAPPRKHKLVRFQKGSRIALTQAQRESAIGEELIALLREILQDGMNTDGLITEDGIRSLNLWADKNFDAEIPAVRYLFQASERILRAGRVTTAKAFEMHFAIERVLPTPLRDEFKNARQDAWLHSPLKPKATPAQLEYIRSLGGDPLPSLNVSEASLLIQQLLVNSTPPGEESATEKQFAFIIELGGKPMPGLSKADASRMIEELLAKGTI